MKKTSKTLIVATVLATLYSVYLFTHFFGGVSESDGIEQAGAALATAMVMPHMSMMFIGAVFGWLGIFLKASWSALVAAILYSVGTVLFMLYAMFGVPILILGFVGYAKQKNEIVEFLGLVA